MFSCIQAENHNINVKLGFLCVKVLICSCHLNRMYRGTSVFQHFSAENKSEEWKRELQLIFCDPRAPPTAQILNCTNKYLSLMVKLNTLNYDIRKKCLIKI